jgi:hypothetical protein
MFGGQIKRERSSLRNCQNEISLFNEQRARQPDISAGIQKTMGKLGRFAAAEPPHKKAGESPC